MVVPGLHTLAAWGGGIEVRGHLRGVREGSGARKGGRLPVTVGDGYGIVDG